MRNIFDWIAALGFAAVLAIGKIYDERLHIAGLNASHFIMGSYAVMVVYRLHKGGFNNRSFYKYIPLLGSLLIIAFFGLINVIIWGYESVDNYTIDKTLTLFTITIPIVFVIFYNSSIKFDRKIVTSIGTVGWFLMLSSIPFVTGYLSGSGRLSVLGGGPIVFSRWVLASLIVLILTSKMPLIIKGVVSLYGITIALFSASKGPLLALFVAIGLVVGIRMFISGRRGVGFVALVITALSWMIMPFVFEKIGVHSRMLVLFDMGAMMETASASSRIERMFVAAQMMADYPIGVGLGNWSKVAQDYGWYIFQLDYPHNVFVEVANESGLIAGILLLASVIYSFFVGFRSIDSADNVEDQRFCLAVVLICAFFLVNSLLSGDLGDARMLLVFCALCVVNHVAQARKVPRLSVVV